jgi:hypothetical protein
MVAARRVADGIFSTPPPDPRAENCAELIRSIGIRAANGCDAECLILFVDPKPTLFHFQHVKRNGDSFSERVLTCIHAGDRINPAVFWGETYHRQELSIRELIGLSTQTIVSAGNLNCGGVSGLDVVFCDSAGLHRVDGDLNREIELAAIELNTYLGDFLMKNKVIPDPTPKQFHDLLDKAAITQVLPKASVPSRKGKPVSRSSRPAKKTSDA